MPAAAAAAADVSNAAAVAAAAAAGTVASRTNRVGHCASASSAASAVRRRGVEAGGRFVRAVTASAVRCAHRSVAATPAPATARWTAATLAATAVRLAAPRAAALPATCSTGKKLAVGADSRRSRTTCGKPPACSTCASSSTNANGHTAAPAASPSNPPARYAAANSAGPPPPPRRPPASPNPPPPPRAAASVAVSSSASFMSDANPSSNEAPPPLPPPPSSAASASSTCGVPPPPPLLRPLPPRGMAGCSRVRTAAPSAVGRQPSCSVQGRVLPTPPPAALLQLLHPLDAPPPTPAPAPAPTPPPVPGADSGTRFCCTSWPLTYTRRRAMSNDATSANARTGPTSKVTHTCVQVPSRMQSAACAVTTVVVPLPQHRPATVTSSARWSGRYTMSGARKAPPRDCGGPVARHNTARRPTAASRAGCSHTLTEKSGGRPRRRHSGAGGGASAPAAAAPPAGGLDCKPAMWRTSPTAMPPPVYDGPGT